MACRTTSQRIDQAGATIGKAVARIQLPAYPAECQTDVPHAQLMLGEEVLSLLKRERGKLDLRNEIGQRCALFYFNLARRLAAENG